MMAIIAVAVFLAFLSVFIGDKREKKRLQNAAHKTNRGNDGIMALAGMVLGGVGVEALDLSDDDYSDAAEDDGVDLSGAAAGALAGAAVTGFMKRDPGSPSLVRTPPPLPAAKESARYNIASIRELRAKTPPRTRQSTPPRIRQTTPPGDKLDGAAAVSPTPRDVEYLSDEWYELYGNQAKRSSKKEKQHQEIGMDAIEQKATMAAQPGTFDQDKYVLSKGRRCRPHQ